MVRGAHDRFFLDECDLSGKELHNNRRPTDKEKAVWEIHPVMAVEVENSDAPAAPAPTASPTIAPVAPPQVSIAPQKFVTIMQPVTIKIRYGETVLQPGMKLPFVSSDGAMVRVRYLDEIQSIPISATDFH